MLFLSLAQHGTCHYRSGVRLLSVVAPQPDSPTHRRTCSGRTRKLTLRLAAACGCTSPVTSLWWLISRCH